ncbi:MAG TPA: sulfotransferase [Solirubrobacterales bacterium]|nr:sulfotransferase [Solirubrobacterales bacterium]
MSEAPSSPRPKVVYVMGAGRSGSTILGVALGNCRGVFYGGELDAWLSRRGEPNFGGEDRERFWAKVKEEMGDTEDLFGGEAQRHIEHSAAAVRLGSRRARRRLRGRYREVAERLYGTLVAETGATHVVDTSHYPLRARELQALGGIDLYLVYLTRAPQAVVAAFERKEIKQPPKAPWATNVYLYATHLLATAVFLRHPRERRAYLRYEDFVSDPSRVLGELLARVDAPAELPDLGALRTGVPFQGNRLLREQEVALRVDEAKRLPRRTLTQLIQAPWSALLPRLRPRLGPGR